MAEKLIQGAETFQLGSKLSWQLIAKELEGAPRVVPEVAPDRTDRRGKKLGIIIVNTVLFLRSRKCVAGD